MNYTDIKNSCIGRASISNNENTHVEAMFDTFLRLTEAKINRFFRATSAEQRASIVTNGDEYYSLPPDFLSLRDIEIVNTDGLRRTCEFLAPEMMNTASNIDFESSVFYTIIANQIQVRPLQNGSTLEVIYYKGVTELTEDETNWMATNHPDCYIYGVLSEISAMMKDSEGLQIWEPKFTNTLESVEEFEQVKKWNGPNLTVRLA